MLLLFGLSSNNSNKKKCKDILVAYYNSIKKDNYSKRKLFRENYLGADKKEYKNITKKLVKEHLESKGCDYNKLMKDRIFIRGIPKVHKGINDLMEHEQCLHKQYENFLSYK